jgi:hypothetical protein
MNEPQNPQASSLHDLEQLVEQAAFLGSFDPLSLVAQEGEQTSAELLSGLAERCVEVPVNDRFQWALTPSARADAFERLTRDDRLHEVAASASRSLLLDDLGGMLVKLVVDGGPSPASVSPPELEMLRVASSFLGDASSSVPMHAINSEIERQSIDQGLAQLRSNGLVGRDAELGQIVKWINESAQRFSMMALSGIGGAGKSALLAELVVRLRGPDWRGHPVVWLDFDHPDRIRLDQASLMSELLRQLALHPGYDYRVAEKYRTYLLDAHAESGDYRSIESVGSASIGNLSAWHAFVDESDFSGLQLLVVCDTFEEVLCRGEDERQQLFQLLHGLSAPSEVARVRVICAGRELPGSPNWKPDLHIPVGDLSPEDAAALFRHCAAQPVKESWPVGALIEKFGGNPLVVKLLARQTIDGGAILGDLLKDDVPADANSELIQGFLYTRILNRIRTTLAAVRKLAFPGLAVRRVSPTLIRDVLAGPCGLGAPGDEECAELFRELARQYWLVQATPDPRVVVHRRDLRRLMLLSMEQRYADTIRQIHRDAAAFYAARRDPALTPQEQRLEGDYHRLLLGELPALETDYAHRLLQTVGTDMPCIPTAARAALKLYAGRELNGAEVNALGERDLKLHQATVRERQSATGATLESFSAMQGGTHIDAVAGAGLNTGNKRGFEQPSLSQQKRPVDPAEIHRAFSLCDFHWLGSVAVEVAELTLEHGSTLGQSREGRTLTESPLWQVCIASLANGRRAELAATLAEGFGTSNKRGERWNRYGSESISFVQGIAAAVRLLDPYQYLPVKRSDLTEDFGRQIDTHEKLRVWQLLGPAFARKERLIRLNLLNYMDQDFFLRPRDPMKRDVEFDTQAWMRTLEKEGMTSYDRPRIASLRRLATAARPVRISPDPVYGGDSVHALAGPAIELYPILRMAVSGMPQNTLMELCESMEGRCSQLWPRELHWDDFAQGLRKEPEQWISTFIEQSDRFGHLEYLAGFTASSVYGIELDMPAFCGMFSRRIRTSLEAHRMPYAWRADTGDLRGGV